MRAIGLVARRHEDPLDELGTLLGGLEQAPSAPDVRFERGHRASRRRADDRLGTQVKDRVDLVLVQRPEQRGMILEFASDDLAAVKGAGGHGAAVGHPVADQDRDPGTARQQLLGEVRA